ncbi:AIR2, partial [Symbiodinium sp. CCMP2456]
MRLSRRSRRLRCWVCVPSRRLARQQRWKKRPHQCEDVETDDGDQEQEMPFWVDCSPDSLIPLPISAPAPVQAIDGEAPKPSAALVQDSNAEDASQPQATTAKEGRAESSRLVFQVVPSTRSAEDVATPSALDVRAEVLQQDDSTFDSLELYYRESTSRPAEMRRRDVKASFALNRYYVHGEVCGSQPEKAQAQQRKSMMSDDGYLTKEGAKRFCMVCCSSGHRAYECPETRCFICWETGHNTKNCPSKIKCKWCNRKGHDEEVCPIRQLRAAEKKREWSEVRCLVCGATGHLACDGSGKWWGGSRWEEAEDVSDGEDGANGEEQVDQTSNNESGTKKALKMARLLGRPQPGASATSSENRIHKEGQPTTKTSSRWDYQDRGGWGYGWQNWGQQGNGWHQSGRENGRDWKARPAPQKKLDRHRGHNGAAARAGPRHKQNRETAPAMRIRDKPSARAEKRARQ